MAQFTYFFERGPLPLLVSMPHTGTQIPADILAQMTPEAARLADTDWHLPQLYDFLQDMGANLLVAINSRYVIDLNRDPAGQALYPGLDNTELCPLSTFERLPLYPEGAEPGTTEVAARLASYWQPYHDKLAATLAELKARHGYALLFDAHSIKPVLPRFFPGRLPDINLGTADQTSADPAVGESLLHVARGFSTHTNVLNGRYKGGYITRRYGRPLDQVHAVQLELSWDSYMDEAGFAFNEAKASSVRPLLRALIEQFVSIGADLH
ncbi:MAG: N-formylglutamate deformylase [Burkholderiales bacterium]